MSLSPRPDNIDTNDEKHFVHRAYVDISLFMSLDLWALAAVRILCSNLVLESGPILFYNRKSGIRCSPTPDFPYQQVLRSINVLTSLTHALMTTMITFVFRCLRALRTSPADHEAGPRPFSPEVSQKGHTATVRSPESPGLILGTREEIFGDSQQPLLLC
jgi:hypothetical protein